MNLHRLVLWANLLLKRSPVGRAKKGSMLEKLRNCIDQLPGCKPFIVRFQRDASSLLECQKILKNRGLSYETVKECNVLLDSIPSSSSVRIGFESWLKAQLQIAVNLNRGESGLPITTDTLESLFGLGKTHGASKVPDAYRIAMRLPAMCGKLTEEDVQGVLEISVSEQKQIMDNIPSLVRQRREILTKQESVENIVSGQERQVFELIP